MNTKKLSRRGFGSVGFLVTLGVTLAVFAGLMIARPWGTAPQVGKTVDTPMSQTTVKDDAFKIWDDGTAYVTGEVREHISGCEVDGECKLVINSPYALTAERC